MMSIMQVEIRIHELISTWCTKPDIDEAKRLLNTVESQIGMSEYFDRSTSVSYTVLNRWCGRLQSLLSEVGDG